MHATHRAPHDFRFTWSAMVEALVSFEMFFLLFLFAGRFKGDPRLSWIPVDLTVALFTASAAIGALIFLSRGYRLPSNIAVVPLYFGAFYLLFIVSRFWSISNYYAFDKSVSIGVLTTFSTFGCAFILGSSRERVVRFACLLIPLGLWISIDFLFTGKIATEIDGEFYQVGGNYLGIGRSVGLALLTCLVIGLKFPCSSPLRTLLFCCVGFFGLVLLKGGGRMPLLATGAAACLVPLYEIWSSRDSRVRSQFTFRVIGFTFLALLVGVISFTSVGDSGDGASLNTINRLAVLFEGDSGASASARQKLWISSIEASADKPLFGYGIGSFPVMFYGSDERGYPHNPFLEVLFETGLIGLLLFVCVLFTSVANSKFTSPDPTRLLIAVLCCNLFWNAFVSGDISDNRMLFGFLGLMAVHPHSVGLIKCRKLST